MKIPFFHKPKVVKKQPKSNSTFYDVIKASYSKPDERRKALQADGYTYDNDLSDHNQQVYYNNKSKKLVFSVAGTHNLKDVVTDGYLLFGGLKRTSRYKAADQRYKEAREKYKPEKSVVVGHSLGGSIASGIGKREDRIMTYNKGVTFGQKSRPNEEVYKTALDPISVLADKKTKTIKMKTLDAHGTRQLKGTGIDI